MPHSQFSLEVLERVNGEWWNSLVQSVPEGTIFQTTCWADYLKEWANVEPLYITVSNKENRVVGLLLCFKEAYLTNILSRRPFASVTTSLLRTLTPIYTWRAGPLILEKKSWREIIDITINKLKGMAGANAISFNLTLPPCELPQEEAREYLIENGFKATHWATFCVDLTPDKQVLWDNLKKTARRAVRRCQEKGVVVERITSEEDLQRYFELLLETRRRLGFNLPPHFPNTIMWRHLRQREAVEVFVAKQDNMWLAALGVFCFNNILREIAAAQSNYSLDNNIYAGDLIKWEVIKWGHKQGYKTYDLAGVSPDPRTAKDKNIYQFKAKWGGKLINYCTYYKQFSGVNKLLASAISLSVGLLERMWRK